MAEGTLITESLRVSATLEGFHMTVRRIHREEADLSPEQVAHGLSRIWTLIDISLSDDEAGPFADALSQALDPFGWYANLQSDTESLVVFARRVFRYPRGDPAGRLAAQSYAREQGVPESQLDWSA